MDLGTIENKGNNDLHDEEDLTIFREILHELRLMNEYFVILTGEDLREELEIQEEL